MTIKIENVPVSLDSRESSNVKDFVQALTKLEVGQSFVSDYSNSNARFAMSVTGYSLNRKFKMVREGESYRYGRIA